MPLSAVIASLGPMPLTRDQFLEQRLVAGGEEAEQRERVLANVGVDVQRTSAPCFGQR